MNGRALTGAMAAWSVLILVALGTDRWWLVLLLVLVPVLGGPAGALIDTARRRRRPRMATRPAAPRRRRPPVRTPSPDEFTRMMRDAGAGDLEDR